MDANRLVAIQENGTRFGLGDPAILSAQLRSLADAIELGYINVEQVVVTNEVNQNDFPMTTVVVSYVEHHSPVEANEEEDEDDGPELT